MDECGGDGQPQHAESVQRIGCQHDVGGAKIRGRLGTDGVDPEPGGVCGIDQVRGIDLKGRPVRPYRVATVGVFERGDPSRLVEGGRSGSRSLTNGPE